MTNFIDVLLVVLESKDQKGKQQVDGWTDGMTTTSFILHVRLKKTELESD